MTRPVEAAGAIPLHTWDFEDLGGYMFEPMIERVCVAQKDEGGVLGGRTVWMVNPNAFGGGVVQLLRTLLPCWRGAGIDELTTLDRATEYHAQALASLLAPGSAGVLTARYSGLRVHGWVDDEARGASMVPDSDGAPDWSRDPVVVSLARWDRIKDPLGILDDFLERVLAATDAHLLLAGPDANQAADEPEAAAVLAEVREHGGGCRALRARGFISPACRLPRARRTTRS